VESILTTTVRFTARDDGILEVEHLPGAGQTTADLVPEQIEALRRLIGDTPRPSLWKPRGAGISDAAVWQRWIDGAAGYLVAVAVVHDEHHHGPLTPFVEASAAALSIPVETFAGEAEAVEWLSDFVKPRG
jgi:hypothetical protein